VIGNNPPDPPVERPTLAPDWNTVPVHPASTRIPRARTLSLAILLALLLPLLVVVLRGEGVVPTAHATARLAAADARPNIVMVMADDMRVDDLTFAPNVRRLIGGDGLTFENSFSPYPLCCPARASFLTGMYAHNHHVYYHLRPYGYRSFDDSRTLATALSAVGYRTGFVGKYLNGYGRDRSLVSGQPSWKYVPNGWTDWIGAFKNSRLRGVHGGTYNYFDTPYNVNGHVDNRYRGKYQTNVQGAFARRLVTKYHGSSAPFFLYLSFVAPHHGSPHEKDDPGRIRRRDGRLEHLDTPARPTWVKGRFDRIIRRPAGLPRNGGPAEADVSDKPSFFRNQPELNRAERRGLTNVTRQRAEAVYVLDRQVGRLVATLKKTGEWNNTVLMFTSDNGYFLGEHRKRQGKVKAHEPSLRVPFLVTGPGMRVAQKRYDPISTVDISATIVDLAGARPPRTADGMTRVPTMLHGDQGWTVPVVTEAYRSTPAERTAAGFDDPRSSIGLRTPRYSFSLYQNGEGELYDLLRDPAEMQNRYSDPAYLDVRSELTEQWWRFKDCVGDACRRELPTAFRATPSDERQWTLGYWSTINRIYGW
jgi:arylsulfatase A-like enzyme